MILSLNKPLDFYNRQSFFIQIDKYKDTKEKLSLYLNKQIFILKIRFPASCKSYPLITVYIVFIEIKKWIYDKRYTYFRIVFIFV